jgi:cytochrome d ubiquinol oxidase subunit II
VLGAIGPVWDGNEVWLVASGGVLFFAFPRAYAAGFSGFYLPLMIALWLLIMRGLSIEFRSREPNVLWRSFWDGAFAVSSVLMTIVLGAALGNIVRGVPVDADGFFVGPLFTDFRPGRHPGVLDWYTVLLGLFALGALAGHGALYLVWKTAGPVRERSQQLAGPIWIATLVVGLLATVATAYVQPRLYATLVSRPWTWLLLSVIITSPVLLFRFRAQRRELPAFLASAAFIISMLGATAAGMFPHILISTLSPRFTLDAYNAAAGALSLRVGLVWWGIAMLLAIGYFIFLFRSFRGKVGLEAELSYHQ